MSQAWLNRQRKQALIDLSSEAGLPLDEDLRKDDLVEKLHNHLQANESRLSRNAALEAYYGTRRSTPVKPRESIAPDAMTAVSDEIAVAKSAAKPRGRPSKKVKHEDSENEPALSSPAAVIRTVSKVLPSASSFALASTATTTAAQTPAARQRRRSELPGPASPADIADVVEHESAKLAASMTDLYSLSGIAQAIDGVRERCSSVTGVQITFLLLEFFALQRDLIPWRFAVDTPALALLGLPAVSLYYPDFFVLLSGHYWFTTLLWGSTSIFVPVLFAYFYNLTIRHVKRNNARMTVVAYTADPLTYNIVKALATWIVYVQGTSFGLINAAAADRVEAAVYGGANGILIGAGVGVLAALYEAALRRPAA